MKLLKTTGLVLLAGSLFSLTSCDGGGGGNVELTTDTDSASYAIGMDISKNLGDQGIEINVDALAAGLRDQTGGEAKFTDEELEKVMMAFQGKMRAKQEEKRMGDAQAGIAKGNAFLAENKSKEGVQSTPSGLQYKIITPGTGASPTLENQVVAHYKGTLIDGKQFDSSYDRGTPATFPLTGVIKGWQESLPMMKVGGKWEIYVPSDLGYGERGYPPDIGPNEVLIFTIELMDIKPADATAPAPVQ